MMRIPATALAILLFASMGTRAQIVEPPSGGERGSFLECVYECKPGPTVGSVATFRQVTTVLLNNQSPADRVANVYYFDGNESCIAHSDIELSPVDLDELNVCHSLESAGITPPESGLLEITTSDTGGAAADGVYAVGKNVLGRFRVDNPEPFQGRTQGIAKYDCRVIPSTVQPDVAVGSKCQTTPPEVDELLIEGTADSCQCNGDLDGDGDVDGADFTLFSGCLQTLPPNPPCDLNCDGAATAADTTVFQCQFNAGFPDPACCP